MATEPGWYPDPSGQVAWRYWDGQTWTQHVADDGLPAVGAAHQASPPHPDDPTPVWAARPTSSSAAPGDPASWDSTSWTSFFRPTIAGRTVHPLIALAIVLVVAALVIGVASGIRTSNELSEYYENRWE